jgi:hypothetical protein
MPELFVFKAGKYPQGDWPEERVRQMVDAYDPELLAAPAVIGHRVFALRDADQFAHGWVESIRMDKDGKVYAVIPEFSLEARHAIAEKKLRYVSVEIYENDKITEGEPPYLRAVALLGRDSPAVAGTKIPAVFSLTAGGVIHAVDEESHISTFTRKVKAEEIQDLSAGQETQEDTTMDGKGSHPAAVPDVSDLFAKLEESRKETAAFKKELDDLKNAGAQKEAEAFFGKLRDEGKLPPALFEKAVALDARLGEEERKEIRSLFSTLEAKVDLSGTHAADKKTAAASGVPDAALTAKIRSFQKEKNLSSFADAAEALHAEKPELFEEEKNDD